MRIETRSAIRVDIKLKVICRIHEDFCQKFGLSCGDSFKLIAVDISVAGIGVISKFFLPKGLILELEIEGIPPDLEKIMKIKGEIRYCMNKKNLGYSCGIKFLDLLDEYKNSITEFIATYEQRKFSRLKLSE
jgi:c-di-GMP-binding flagellar brake protein YcgR